MLATDVLKYLAKAILVSSLGILSPCSYIAIEEAETPTAAATSFRLLFAFILNCLRLFAYLISFIANLLSFADSIIHNLCREVNMFFAEINDLYSCTKSVIFLLTFCTFRVILVVQ